MKKFKKSVPFYISVCIVLLCIIMMLGFVIKAVITYHNGFRIEHDKTSNINVMLTRPENWQKIESGKINLTKDDFSKIDGSTATIPITAELARQFCNVSDDDISEYVDHNTTHSAYMNLIATKQGYVINNKTNKYLIFVTEPSEDELNRSSERNIELDVTPVALDGFVFITHKDNPVESLTVEQIQKYILEKLLTGKK